MPACGEAEALAERRPPTSDDPGPDIEAREVGERLREARLALGRDLSDLARDLRTREAWLVAIEVGRFDELPDAPTRAGLVGSYADSLGLDGAALAARLGTPEGGRRSGVFLRDGAGRLRGHRVLALAAMLAAAAGGGWYLMADSGVPPEGTAPVSERSSDPPEKGPEAEMPATVFPGDAATAPARTPAPDREPAGASAPSPADPAPTPGPPDAERIRAVQRALARLGYDPGPADGLMGPRTRAAIRAFQAASGLAADGGLTPELERGIRLAADATGS